MSIGKQTKVTVMSSATITVGELLYEVTVHFTKVTEYGLSLGAVVSGQVAPPPAGARFDVAFDGVARGPKLKGTIAGVDYLHMRADGRTQLHIHAEITTDDGEKIAFFGGGVATPEPGTGVMQLRENVTLTTASPVYAWVNQLQVWALGTVDPVKGEVNVKGYAA
jgi:hypothetical protein